MKCQFTHNIADQLECDPDGNFDDNGIPIVQCKEFPCNKYNKIIKNLSELKNYKKEIINYEI
jgi:hypothetical protein